jgi:hypothetical protein
MHPPALIDTCMSFRNAQLQEVRTAPAAHGKGHPQEGPVACPTLDGQDAQVMVGWGLGREGCQRLLVRFYTVSPRIGQGGSRVVTMAEGAARGAGKGKAVPRCRRLIVEMRKRNYRSGWRGGSRMVGVVDLVAVWHSAVFGKTSGVGECF